jgi:hypothetical protein
LLLTVLTALMVTIGVLTAGGLGAGGIRRRPVSTRLSGVRAIRKASSQDAP